MASQAIAGIASGLDTASIVEALMNIQRQSYTRTSEKVEAEKLKLQAYQSVNSMLLSLKNSVNTLSSTSLWNGKTTSSSNETSLSATASQYAVEGSYSLRVAQLASAAQYMSQGYSSSTSTVISSSSSVTSGTITLESSQARVDNSAKLEDLNGGNGVYRGSIRITDASGSTTVVDLSACETVDQVVSAINSAAGIQVQASVRTSDDGNGSGDRLEIIDTSGGAGTMKIQNVGQGTTATNLGIAGSSTIVNGAATITGSSIYYLSTNTSLTTLRGGLGIEDGRMCITINGDSGELDIYVDLTDVQTVGDVLNAVNTALKNAANGDEAMAHLAEGLTLSLNADKNGFTFSGGKTGYIYTVSELWEDGKMAKPETVSQLGLVGTFSVENDGDSFGGARLVGDISSPLLSNLSGANKTGIGSESSRNTVAADSLELTTRLRDLNGGAGLGDITSLLQFRIYEGGGSEYRIVSDLLDYDELRLIATDTDATVGDLLEYINKKLEDTDVAMLQGVRLELDSVGKGIQVSGLSSAHTYEILGSVAESLGIVYLEDGTAAYGWGAKVEAGSYSDLDNLYSFVDIRDSGNMLFETTTLAELNIGGSGFDETALNAMLSGGTIQIKAGSVTVNVDLSALDSTSTLGDFIDTVNDAIEQAYTMAGSADPQPFLAIDFTASGLNWRNVDIGEDFEVTGAFADIIGIDKNYTGQTYATTTTDTQKNLNPVVTGTSEPVDLTGTDILASLNAGAGISFTGDRLTVKIGDDGNAQYLNVSRDEILAALGGSISTATVDQYVAALNALFNQKIADHQDLDENVVSLAFGMSADGTGITLTSVTGLADGTMIEIDGDLATAATGGIAAATGTAGTDFAMDTVADIRSVTIDEKQVDGLGYIRMEINGSEVVLNTDGLDQSSTLNDLIYTLNKQLAALGHTGMSFSISDSGTGIAFSNDSGDPVTFKYDEVSTLASDLGLVGTSAQKTDTTVSANSHLNCSSLNRNYISRSTLLSSLNNGAGADLGVITVTSAQGTSVNIDLSEAKCVGDIIDAINGLLYGVEARINDAGDGIVIVQTDDTGVDGKECTGNISVTSADGSKTAEHLGIAGTGVGGEDGLSVLDGSMKTVISVSSTDTLTDIMNRVSDAGYKASIINDGTGANSYRLSIAAASTGAGHDFIIDTDISGLAMQQVARGQDSMVLYGDPDSGMSPVVLKSSTNTNNTAILGLTLNLNDTSESYTTITVSTDTSAVVDAIQELVQAYNDLSDLITYLDAYDTSTETKGILFGDSTIRTLMDTVDEMFYQVYNPDNLTYSEVYSSGTRKTWTWTDLGISFSANNSNSDGESGYWYSRMELDLDALDEMVNSNWDTLKEMMSSQRNASDSTLSQNTAASSGFNFKYDTDENGNVIYPENSDDPNRAINGDKSSGFGVSNGFTANKSIDEGENQYTIYFQQPTTLDRISIYHPNDGEYLAAEYSLKDFIVEYLDPNTGKWETLREVSGNSSYATIIGLGTPTTVSAIRITASSTNAEDGKFRLLDVQCLESNGLASKLSQVVNSLTDVVDGYFTQANADVEDKISDLQEQMSKMEERLAAKEEALWRKFNAMESALSALQNQSNYLATMFSSMSSSS